PVLDEIVKLSDIKFGIFPRRFRETFRNHRPAATPALLSDANLIPGSLQKLSRGLSDVGIVVINKRIVKEDDFARRQSIGRTARGAISVGEPRLESLRRKQRKLTSRINADKPIESAPKDRIGQSPIGQAWPHGGHFTCSVNVREHPRPKRCA